MDRTRLSLWSFGLSSCGPPTPAVKMVLRFAWYALFALPLMHTVDAKDWNAPSELTTELAVYRGLAAATLGIHFWCGSLLLVYSRLIQ